MDRHMDLHYIKTSWNRQSSPSGSISEQENVCLTPRSCWFSGSYIKFEQWTPNGHRHSLFNISSKEVSHLTSLHFLASRCVRIKRIMVQLQSQSWQLATLPCTQNCDLEQNHSPFFYFWDCNVSTPLFFILATNPLMYTSFFLSNLWPLFFH